MNRQTPSLVICILMDVLGYASYAVPGLGELSDVVFAPVSAIIFYRMLAVRKAHLEPYLILQKRYFHLLTLFHHLQLCGFTLTLQMQSGQLFLKQSTVS